MVNVKAKIKPVVAVHSKLTTFQEAQQKDMDVEK